MNEQSQQMRPARHSLQRSAEFVGQVRQAVGQKIGQEPAHGKGPVPLAGYTRPPDALLMLVMLLSSCKKDHTEAS